MLGYFLALLIGLSLGILGGGGSILTVPVLVYIMGFGPKLAIALSLAIVGGTSLLGVYGHYKNKNIDFKIASLFAPFAMIGTFGGAKLSQFLTGQTQLILFAIIMLLASFSMLKKSKKDSQSENQLKKINIPLVIIEGLIVGVITGIVGVGGGFLIVPALVLLTGLPMKKAIGTSLLIISLKSFSGFLGYIGFVEIPWTFLGQFLFFSGSGIFLGSYLIKFIPPAKLKKSFAVFLIIMGSFILIKNREKVTSTEILKKSETKISFQKKIKKEVFGGNHHHHSFD